MSYLQDLPTSFFTDPRLVQGSGPLPESVASLYPLYEVTSPQYPIPSVYKLMTQGYRSDELAYSLCNYRADAISEPRLCVFKGRGRKKKEVAENGLALLMDNPNSEMGQLEFWKATEIYRCIAGFSIWEKERNRMGEVIALWPMNPLWCSIMRGPNEPIRVVRYQVPGLPLVDIPRERLVIFQELDPQYPMLRSYSRMQAAFRSINVHASVTDFLKLFFERGAIPQGLLTTVQQLQKAEGDRIKKKWREDNGGWRNWTDVSVIGSGITYQSMQMDFDKMGFEAIDGRTEALICTTFGVSPLLMAVKVGLTASTLSNYDQAKDQFLTQTVIPSWRWYQSEMTQQLLPDFNDDETAELYCEFDTSEVSGMQEDEAAVWDRNLRAAQQNLIYRDQFLANVGLEPVDNGNKVFVGVSIRTVDPSAEEARITNPDLTDEQIQAKVAADTAASAAIATGQPINPANTDTTQPPDFGKSDTTANADLMKTWRTLALANVGQSVGAPFDSELLACKSKQQVRRVFEKYWEGGQTVTNDAELTRLNDNIEEAVKALTQTATPAPSYMPLSLSVPSEFDVTPLKAAIVESEARTSSQVKDLQDMVLTTVQDINGKITPITINVPMEELIGPMITEIRKASVPDLAPMSAVVDKLTQAVEKLQTAPPVVFEEEPQRLIRSKFTYDKSGRINGSVQEFVDGSED